MPGFSDDNAIASDKTGYLPASGAASFANVSSYLLGINGVMIDLAGAHGTLAASDFIFRVGNNNSPSAWTTAPAPSSISIRPGAGIGGSDRLEITWPNNSVKNTWLEVTLKGDDALGGSDANTGLATSYVFFYGSAPGDTGVGDASQFLVDSSDASMVIANPKSVKNAIPITNPYDINRDGAVDSSDVLDVLTNGTYILNALRILNILSGVPFAAPAATGASATASLASPATALAATVTASLPSSAGTSAGGLPPLFNPDLLSTLSGGKKPLLGSDEAEIACDQAIAALAGELDRGEPANDPWWMTPL
jgi:hypothetical protein